MDRLYRPVFLFFILLFPHFLHASKEDSLKALLPAAPDSQKIKIYMHLGWNAKNTSDAKMYYGKAEALIDSLHLDRKAIACYSYEGVVLEKYGEFDLAMKCFFTSLSKATAVGDSSEIAGENLDISWLYFLSKKMDIAEQYGNTGLQLYERLNDKAGIANACNNLATYKKEEGKYPEALALHERSLAISRELHDAGRASHSLNNIGLVYLKMEKYPEAIDYLNQSFHIKDSLGDIKGMAGSLINISNAYLGMKDFQKALDFALRGTKLADSSGDRVFLKNGYEAVGESYRGLGDYKNALDYEDKYIDLSQQLLNDKSVSQINELQAKYESDKKEKEIAMLNMQNDLQKSELLKSRMILIAVSGGGLLLIVLAFVVFRGYRQKKRTLVVISGIRDKLEQKNKEISDSINYAKNIQRSLLPVPEQLQYVFSDSFVLNVPKDIVSGDFFSLVPKDGKHYLAVADCTGHGVPGAFMSMVGIDKLNQAILESKTGMPGEILSLLNKFIRETFHQKDTVQAGIHMQDGMDIALVCFDKMNGKSFYAGANRPLWIIRNGEIIEFRPTKAAIGGATEDDQVFEGHEIDLMENDQLFLFSDGYADQFGGAKGKKMMTKNFRSLLLNACNMPFDSRKDFLRSKLKEWQGHFEQVDDILVVGVKV